MERCRLVSEVVVVARAEERSALTRLCKQAAFAKVTVVSPGGRTRQDSVRIGLQALNPKVTLVAVHDAARPFLPLPLLSRCVREAARSGAAIAAVQCSDTLKASEELTITLTLSREAVWLAQTPQVFDRALLVRAHQQARRDHDTATDDAGLVERLGHPVRLVPSSAINFKLTTAADLQLARLVAQDQDRLAAALGW
jgi:2-C-methyl-D-erythritol 4-phosphate cytidylyltransferase